MPRRSRRRSSSLALCLPDFDRALDKDETLFQQGDPGDSMYILVRGVLRIRASNPDGGETVLDILDPGASVGEMALLTGQRAQRRSTRPTALSW